eukprot:235962-Pleurochrysis_carterae.AAC.1
MASHLEKTECERARRKVCPPRRVIRTATPARRAITGMPSTRSSANAACFGIDSRPGIDGGGDCGGDGGSGGCNGGGIGDGGGGEGA